MFDMIEGKTRKHIASSTVAEDNSYGRKPCNGLEIIIIDLVLPC